MTRDDLAAFAGAWTSASALYGRQPTSGAVQLAFDALASYDLRAVTRALSDHIRDPDAGRYQQKPADLIRIIDGDADTGALRAWSAVDAAVRTVGPYQSVVFDDPRIHATIAAMGGWVALGSVKTDEWPFKANEFVRRFRGHRGVPAQYPRVLNGIAQGHNDTHYASHVAPPIMVGDEAKCRRVYSGGTDQPLIGMRSMEEQPRGIE